MIQVKKWKFKADKKQKFKTKKGRFNWLNSTIANARTAKASIPVEELHAPVTTTSDFAHSNHFSRIFHKQIYVSKQLLAKHKSKYTCNTAMDWYSKLQLL